jgi:hypothetical protein
MTGTRVCLTLAHLVSATQLPVELHVARATQANEIVNLIGFLVATDPKRLEGDDVMHDRALAELLGTAPANGARFVVALPGCAPRSQPGGPVILQVTARPEWIVLSGWRLGSPPCQAADVATEATPRTQVIAGDAIFVAAPFANSLAERALRSANEFSATGIRASEDAIRRLLRRDRDYLRADGALDAALAPTLCASDARMFYSGALSGHESCLARGGTGAPRPARVVGEVVPAGGAGNLGRAQTWSRHAQLYHVGYLPENCAAGNLLVMCNFCHLSYDAEHHASTRARVLALALGATMDPLIPEETP